jgi:AcrR family transcriptional regulator
MNRARGSGRQSRERQTETPSSGAPAPKKTRDRLLHPRARGYAAASAQAIAERCGVAAGTLYRHFPSKADLFVELVRGPHQGQTVDPVTHGSTRDRIELTEGETL